MRTGTRLMVGGILVATGVFVASLGWFAQGSTVRQVSEVLDAPAEHATGTYTLVGIPQPALVPLVTAEGTVMAPNPEHPNATVSVVPWVHEGVAVHSTHTLRAAPGAGPTTVFTLTNETRRPGQPDLVMPPSTRTWEMPGTAFPVRGFQAGAVSAPVVWAIYEGPFKDPLQPKPSQFTGRLASSTAQGPLPDGAHVFLVEAYTAGCSSKFIPAEEQERLARANVTMQ